MMSAILQLLEGILKEKLFDKKQAIIDLCAAAYPDIRPWQVEDACEERKSCGSNNLYYMYLSQLLHPIDGHDAARRDDVLVKVSYIASFSYFSLVFTNLHFCPIRNGVNCPSMKSGMPDVMKQ